MHKFRISTLDFARFHIGSDSEKKEIAKQYTPKKRGEFRAHYYYREARSAIKTYHIGRHDDEWLASKAESVRELIESKNTSQAKARLNLNHVAIINYLNSEFRKRNLVIASMETIMLPIDNLVISSMADFRVFEDSRDNFIKLDYTKSLPSKECIQAILSCMYWGYSHNHLPFNNALFSYWNLASGKGTSMADIDLIPLDLLKKTKEKLAVLYDTAANSPA